MPRPPTLPMDEIRCIERRALAAGLPLMARAGLHAARWAQTLMPSSRAVAVLVGPGNNGGDALAAACALHDAGVDVTVWRGTHGALPADAHRYWQVWCALGGRTRWAVTPRQLARTDLIIDGVFGIGLNRPLGAPWSEMIRAANRSGRPILALDVPSGWDARHARVLGEAVMARWTMSFIAVTPGLHSQAGRRQAGECRVQSLDIGAALLLQAHRDYLRGRVLPPPKPANPN